MLWKGRLSSFLESILVTSDSGPCDSSKKSIPRKFLFSASFDVTTIPPPYGNVLNIVNLKNLAINSFKKDAIAKPPTGWLTLIEIFGEPTSLKKAMTLIKSISPFPGFNERMS
jgi:hypothetical protein